MNISVCTPQRRVIIYTKCFSESSNFFYTFNELHTYVMTSYKFYSSALNWCVSWLSDRPTSSSNNGCSELGVHLERPRNTRCHMTFRNLDSRPRCSHTVPGEWRGSGPARTRTQHQGRSQGAGCDSCTLAEARSDLGSCTEDRTLPGPL